jgi:protein SCO1/2
LLNSAAKVKMVKFLLLLLLCLMGLTRAEAAVPLVPVHATIVGLPQPGRLVVRFDEVPKMVDSETRGVEVEFTHDLRIGEEIDALLDRSSGAWRLTDIRQAARYVPGLPDPDVSHILGIGDRLPNVPMLDQRGRRMMLGDVAGKTTVLSFIFSRCPDRTICPAISGKFAYLQKHLDARHFHLIEITLDPRYDSPAVLAAYGRDLGADPTRWTLATSEPSIVNDLISAFGLSSLADRPGNLLHDDRLIVADGDGVIRQLLITPGWDPNDLISLADQVAGLTSNPLRRLELSAIANVISVCGGSASTAEMLLLLGVMGFVLLVSAVFLTWWAQRLRKNQ